MALMNIGILTMYYSNISHGGLLQAYSLCHFLRLHGYEHTEQISYDYNYRFRLGTVISKVKRAIRKAPYNVFLVITKDKTKELYNSFMQEIPHSGYYSPDTIQSIAKEYDCFIVGSDQVWNMSYCDSSYYLPFVANNKKITYAASVGKDRLEQGELKQLCDAVKSFYAVSVREKSLKTLLESMDIRETEHVCDPVFLMDRSFWEEQSKEVKINDKYTLVYLLSGSRKEKNHALKLARRTGNKIVVVPNVNLNMSLFDLCLDAHKAYSVGPREFIGLIKNADFVITDSFHCVAFSLIMNVSFYAISRMGNDFGMDSRIHSILDSVGLKDRFLTFESREMQIEKVDFGSVNERIEQLAGNSQKWLLQKIHAIEKPY